MVQRISYRDVEPQDQRLVSNAHLHFTLTEFLIGTVPIRNRLWMRVKRMIIKTSKDLKLVSERSNFLVLWKKVNQISQYSSEGKQPINTSVSQISTSIYSRLTKFSVHLKCFFFFDLCSSLTEFFFLSANCKKYLFATLKTRDMHQSMCNREQFNKSVTFYPFLCS